MSDSKKLEGNTKIPRYQNRLCEQVWIYYNTKIQHKKYTEDIQFYTANKSKS